MTFLSDFYAPSESPRKRSKENEALFKMNNVPILQSIAFLCLSNALSCHIRVGIGIAVAGIRVTARITGEYFGNLIEGFILRLRHHKEKEAPTNYNNHKEGKVDEAGHCFL